LRRVRWREGVQAPVRALARGDRRKAATCAFREASLCRISTPSCVACSSRSSLHAQEHHGQRHLPGLHRHRPRAQPGRAPGAGSRHAQPTCRNPLAAAKPRRTATQQPRSQDSRSADCAPHRCQSRQETRAPRSQPRKAAFASTRQLCLRHLQTPPGAPAQAQKNTGHNHGFRWEAAGGEGGAGHG
jgi:hypothetical protein